jgi:hypothetical protein
MLNRVKNVLNQMNSLSPAKKLLLLLVIAIIVVVVLVALDIIPKDAVFPSNASQVSGSNSGTLPSIPEMQPRPDPVPEPMPAMPEPLIYIGSGGCVGGNQEIPEGHCDTNPQCTAIGRQFNGCWHQLKGEVPDQAQRDTYKWGLFKKSDSGYEPI